MKRCAVASLLKLSVSIPDADVEFIDQYADEHGVESRSGVVQRAVSLLRASELGDDYAAAWAEWADSDRELWAAADADGLEGVAR
ncbi:MAG: ribbon-helix-helix domain-containing protein [Acidimicrobiia bacterium]